MIMGDLFSKKPLKTELNRFARQNNLAEEKLGVFFSDMGMPYEPLVMEAGKPQIDPTAVMLGYDVYGLEYTIPYAILTSRSIAVIGKTRSGKTTLVIRMLYELLNQDANMNVKIIDPEGDAFSFFDDPRIEHIDVSGYRDKGDRWNIAAGIFEQSLNRPLARDAPDLPYEVIIIEEANKFCPEHNLGLGHLDKFQKSSLHMCSNNIENLAEMGIKRRTILILIFQSPYRISKAVLRQIGTFFVFKLSRNETKSLPDIWLISQQYEIEQAYPGLCHACGEGIPGQTGHQIFQVAQVDEMKTSDSR